MYETRSEKLSDAGYRTAAEAQATREQPRLYQQCEQMAKVLACINEQVRRLEQAANRLTHPRPQAAEKLADGPTTPKAITIEQQYAMLIGAAEQINLRLSETAAHLDAAV